MGVWGGFGTPACMREFGVFAKVGGLEGIWGFNIHAGDLGVSLELARWGKFEGFVGNWGLGGSLGFPSALGGI